MLILLSLFGFAPLPGAPQIGPDAPALARTPALQLRLDQSSRAARFRERQGPLPIRWDERNGTPRAVLLDGRPEAQADALVDDLALLAGVEPADLVFVGVRGHGDLRGLRWQQRWQGVPVEGGTVDVFVEGGRIRWVLASLHRVRGVPTPLPGEVVLPLQPTLDYALATRAEEGDEVVYRDRAGRELHRYTERRPMELTAYPRSPFDALVPVPARQFQVTDDLGVQELTGDDGLHTLGPPVDLELLGPLLSVESNGTPQLALDVDDELVEADVEVTAAAATVAHHFYVVRDWLALRAPTNPWLPEHVPAQVDLTSGSCNAYYVGGTINFYQEGKSCSNLGELADVIYHEYGHGVHHHQVVGGVVAGDIGEGSADFIAATINDDPRTGLGSSGPSDFIRELDSDHVYPDDYVGEVHEDGLIWGSFLWDLREAWVATYGAETGVQMTDELFLRALSYGPSLTDAYEAVLAADDDDADLTNGTPHDCELATLMDAHGIGPGPMGYVLLDLTPVPDQPSYAPGPRVDFSLTSVTGACSDFDPDSATVKWVVDPLPGTPVELLTPGEVAPTRADTAYTAQLPALPAGSYVAWWIEWSTTDGQIVQATHDGTVDGAHWYRVGDRRTLWCEDFESGAASWTFGPGALDGEPVLDKWKSEWELGASSVYEEGPLAPYEGATFLGTNLTDGDGEYDDNNDQYALSPLVDLEVTGARSLLVLSAQRWLTVEKSEYDHADVVAVKDGVGELLWRNPYDTDVRDPDWTEHVLDLRHLRDRGEVQLGWTLSTDPGLEYGGWSLDLVCVEALDDPEGHYHVQDLAAEVETGTRLTWTQPFVVPLYATALVRSRDGIPTSVDDGVIVDLDLVPEPGGSREIVDAEALPDETYHYALFAADAADSWFLEAVVGENVVTVEADAPEPPDAEPPADDVDPADEGEDVRGCGCAQGGAGLAPWSLLLVAGLVLRRRRQRS